MGKKISVFRENDVEYLKDYLVEAVREVLLEEDEILLDEAALSFSEMAKSPARFQAFINKIEKGEPFELVGGGEVVLDKDPQVIAVLKGMLDAGNISTAAAQEAFGTRNIRFKTSDGGVISLAKLQKTGEFGGKGSEFYVKKEIAARGQLDDLIQKAMAAAGTEAIIIKVVSASGEELARWDDVVGVGDTEKVGGVDPKSDFQLIRKDGKPAVFISHKDGTSPAHFGQWGGTSAKAGERISSHPEIKNFVEVDLMPYLKKETGSDGKEYLVYPRGLSVGKKIEDRDLQLMSIFGQDYKAGGPGSVNNCDLVAQGLFSLKTDEPEQTTDDQEVEVVYTLTAQHLMVRADLDSTFPAGYAPALVTRYATGRNNYGVRGMRMTIYPEAGRKVHKWIGDGAEENEKS